MISIIAQGLWYLRYTGVVIKAGLGAGRPRTASVDKARSLPNRYRVYTAIGHVLQVQGLASVDPVSIG